MIGQANDSITVKNSTITGSTVTGASAIGGLIGPLTVTAEKATALIDNCGVIDCKVVQKGSFGASYDELFGSVFGYIEASSEKSASVNVNKCYVENTSVKEDFDYPMANSVDGDLFIDGYKYVADGVFIKDEEYYLSNANGLLWVEKQEDNFFSGKTIKLKNNIDCKGTPILPIRLWDPENKSVFDGQNFVISNVDITANKASNNQALFNGTLNIKNVVIDGATVHGRGYTAVLAGTIYGNIDNCTVKNSEVIGTYWQTGILAAQYNSGNITNCSVIECDVYSPSAAGAIVGILNETTGERKIENCIVKDCNISANGGFGGDYDNMFGVAVGLVNISSSTVYFTNCEVSGNTVKNVDSDVLCGVVESDTEIIVN